MKKKSLLLCSSIAFLSVAALAGCIQDSNTIIVWVGSESVSYYRDKAKEFLASNPEFGYGLRIIGADTGGAAGQMVADNTACGDIVTIAHDNIGKLSRSNRIAPIVDDDLLEQIANDNPNSFKSVITNFFGETDDMEQNYTFAVPYISQALFLYYDTRYVTAEEAKTFDGLIQAAKRYDSEHGVTGTKSYTVTGTDGYNFSFSLLARNLTAGNKSALRLFVGGERYDSYAQDNDMVAVVRWMQRNYKDPNGVMFDNAGTPWNTSVENHLVLSAIGGAWHYNAFAAAVGKENMGCAIIPSFTLSAEDVAGIGDVTYPMDNGYTNPNTGKVFKGLPQELQGSADAAPVAGTEFRGGSFVDCKCFVINMAKMTGPEKYAKMCQVLKYFSSKDVQNESFVKALNVPAYLGADEFIETAKDQVADTAYLMAKAQTGMADYGIPQPIIDGTTNTFYYSKNGPDYYLNCIKQLSGNGVTIQDIRETLFKMEYVWKHGSLPKYESGISLPADTSIPRT